MSSSVEPIADAWDPPCEWPGAGKPSERAAAAPGDDIDRALVFAVQRKDLATSQQLVRRGARVETREPTLWRTPLIVAAQDGAMALVAFLLDQGADVGAEDDFGNTALTAAAEEGSAALLGRLIAEGAELDHRNDLAWTPLISACASGNLAAVDLLAQHGASIEARSLLGWTPLIVAAQRAHADVAARLLELGADVEAADSFGRTARAAAGPSRRVMEVLDRHAIRHQGKRNDSEV